MDLYHLHDWNLTPAQAVALQIELARHLVHDQPLDLSAVRLIAGVDVSVKNDVSQAAVVALSFPDLQLVEAVTAAYPTPFPYIPGLLTFREGPSLEAAFQRLRSEPDVFIFDGMGRIHPRRIGIASHMGLWLDRPTVGCGKSHLIGEYVEPGNQTGDFSPLRDGGEVLGVVLRTRPNVKPVYVSVGHRADLNTAIELVLRCTTKYRLPEPIRQAHTLAGQFD